MSDHDVCREPGVIPSQKASSGATPPVSFSSCLGPIKRNQMFFCWSWSLQISTGHTVPFRFSRPGNRDLGTGPLLEKWSWDAPVKKCWKRNRKTEKQMRYVLISGFLPWATGAQSHWPSSESTWSVLLKRSRGGWGAWVFIHPFPPLHTPHWWKVSPPSSRSPDPQLLLPFVSKLLWS